MNRLDKLKQNTGEDWRRMRGGWPTGTIYDQYAPSELATDQGWCVAAALTNSATAVNGLIGKNYPSMIYERAKARQGEEKQEKTGISVPEAAAVAKEIFGGGETFRLRTLPEVIAWISIAPVVCGFLWDEGMANPHTKAGFWNFFTGARWIKPTPSASRLSHYKHAVTIYGTTPKEGGFVKVENSAGLSWGNKGSARLAHNDLADMLARGDAQAYGIEWPSRPIIRK